ncbi:hypothetical protein B0H14DRAFT_2774885 [Mycena olivaceomarginata]|nr:hypothetical protein B0H14DRAFT_2774885 [Mycena olivaceomarginata]
MSITNKEMKKTEAKFIRRLEKIYQELDSMREEMLAFFHPPDDTLPAKTKKQLASIPKPNGKPSRPLARKASKASEQAKSEKKRARKSERKLKNALKIPPMFKALEIQELRKPRLEELLGGLNEPVNAKKQRRATSKIISILEKRRAEFEKQNKTATDKDKTTGRQKSTAEKRVSDKAKAAPESSKANLKTTRRTKSPKVKGGEESFVEPATDGDAYEPANAQTSSGHHYSRGGTDDANISDNYGPQAGTYDEDDERTEDMDEEDA